MFARAAGVFSFRLIAAAALAGAPVLAAAVPAASSAARANGAPDVLVLVLSGVLPTRADAVSFTYGKAVSDATARADLKSLVSASGWKAMETRMSSQQGMTSVEFRTEGVVKWEQGILPVEPFVRAFKRFDRVQINYLLPPGFKSHSLKNYSDRYVDIGLTLSENTYVYQVKIKDHEFDRLNLPLTVVEPQSQRHEPPAGARSGGSGGAFWIALVLAFAAAAIVFVMISRLSRK